MRLQGGNADIGTNNPGVKLHVRGNRIRLEKSGSTQILDLRADGGALDIESTDADLYLNNNNRPVRIRNLVQGSSREWKEDIAERSIEEATQVFERLNPTTFTFKEDTSRQRHLGFVAEELPSNVVTSDGKGSSPMAIIAVLTKVVRAQEEKIATLQEEPAALKARVQ